MQRETKVGLLVGMGVILLIGIIVSDHLSVVQKQDAARLDDYGNAIQNGMTPPGDGVEAELAAHRFDGPLSARRQTVVPIEGDLQVLPPPDAGAPRPTVADGSPVDPRFVQGGNTTGTPTLTGGNFGVPAPGNSAPGIPGPGNPGGVNVGTPAPEPQVVHFVEARQTLYQIAKKYYGNGEEWRRIADANPTAVGRNGAIRPGVRLVIPLKPQAPSLAGNPDLIPVTPQQAGTLQPGTRFVADAGTGRTVTVGPGDTLTKIAGRHLGDKHRWQEIIDANPGIDPRNLKVGTVLKLPAPAPGSSAPGIVPGSGPGSGSGPLIAPGPIPQDAAALLPAPGGAAPATGNRTYTVQRGDTLSSIALKTLGDKQHWQRLYEANRGTLAQPSDLTVGQQLVVPVL